MKRVKGIAIGGNLDGLEIEGYPLIPILAYPLEEPSPPDQPETYIFHPGFFIAPEKQISFWILEGLTLGDAITRLSDTYQSARLTRDKRQN